MFIFFFFFFLHQLCLRFIFTTNPSLWLLATPLYSNNLTPITPQTYGTEEVSLLLSEGYTKKSYAILYNQWHRPMSKWPIIPPYSISRATSIDSDCCLTHGQYSQQKSGKITLQSVLTNKPQFQKAISSHAEISKIVTPRSMSVEA